MVEDWILTNEKPAGMASFAGGLQTAQSNDGTEKEGTGRRDGRALVWMACTQANHECREGVGLESESNRDESLGRESGQVTLPGGGAPTMKHGNKKWW